MLVTFHRDLFHCFLILANYIKVLFWAKITPSSIQLPNYCSEIKIDWSCVFLTCKFYSAWFVWAAGKADGHWINRCKDCLHCGLIIDPLIITKRQPVLFLRKYDKGRTEKLASSQFHYRLQKKSSLNWSRKAIYQITSWNRMFQLIQSLLTVYLTLSSERLRNHSQSETSLSKDRPAGTMQAR